VARYQPRHSVLPSASYQRSPVPRPASRSTPAPPASPSSAPHRTVVPPASPPSVAPLHLSRFRKPTRGATARGALVLLGIGIIAGAFLLPDNQGGNPLPRQHRISVATSPVTQHRSGALSTVRTAPNPHAPTTRPMPATGTGPRSGAVSGTPSSPGTTSPVTTSPLVSSSRAVNLPVPKGLGPALRHAWVTGNAGGVGLTAADVRSTAAGSVFYAGQRSIGTDWAISRFVPTSFALQRAGTRTGRALLAQFGYVAAFMKASRGSWAYVGEATGPCSLTVPGPVLAAWGLCRAVGS